MRFSYKFSNLCGTVYKQGNLVFTPDGNKLLSPVGNRITLFDLVNHKCSTLPTENQRNINAIALAPSGSHLISVDEDGRALLINLNKQVVISHFNFKKKVTAIQFSPDSKFFAVSHGAHVQVWRTPELVCQFAPFTLHREYTGHYADVTCITWSHDGRYFVTGAADNSARLYSLNPEPGFVPTVLTGHRSKLVGCFFAPKDNTRLYTVAYDGALYKWRFVRPNEEAEAEDEDGEPKEVSQVLNGGRFKIEGKHYFNQDHAKAVCASFHPNPKFQLLVVGFSSGIFGLYELPDFTNIHTLSISQHNVDTVAVNNTGEWLAFGSSTLGQLLVWEWKSETYVLKQQGHTSDVNTLSFSPDGQLVATGGADGKLKLWNTQTGFCFVTFAEHTAPITCVQFSATGNVVITASLDGTVRAFDLIRYRNFRTMTASTPTQFISLALDPSGEIICAGTLDPFEICVWSLQTGKLLDTLAGHEGPISGLAFSPQSGLLGSSSWDKTVRTWDIFAASGARETFQHGSDVLALAFRGDGKELCTASLDGQLHFWDAQNGVVLGVIDGRKDILGGRETNSARTAKNSTSSHFTSICYSADGQFLLAGGTSKWVCVYNIAQRVLVRKWQVSRNRSLDGVLDFLNSKLMTDAGSLDLIEDEDDEEMYEKNRVDESLPGVRQGDMSTRKTKPTVLTKCVRFSPTGQMWAACSTEGLLLYSLDDIAFDPVDLDVDITPATILATVEKQESAKALVMALRLNEVHIIKYVLESTDPREVELVARSMPTHHLKRLMEMIADGLGSSRQLEFYLRWLAAVLSAHGQWLMLHRPSLMPTFRTVRKNLTTQQEALSRMCSENQYMLSFICSQSSTNQSASLSASQSESKAEEEMPLDDAEDNEEEGGVWQSAESVKDVDMDEEEEEKKEEAVSMEEEEGEEEEKGKSSKHQKNKAKSKKGKKVVEKEEEEQEEEKQDVNMEEEEKEKVEEEEKPKKSKSKKEKKSSEKATPSADAAQKKKKKRKARNE